MITQRAYLLGVVAFCFYLIAIVNDLPPFYYLLTWLSLGILASSLGVALLSLVGLNCDWRLTQARAAQAHEDALEKGALHGPRLEIELTNSGTLNKTGVLIEVVLERVVAASAATASANAARSTPGSATLTRRFLLEALPAGESVRTELVLRDLQRGRYRLCELRMIGSEVLGLFRITRRIAGTAPADDVPADGPLADGPLAREAPADDATRERELIVGPALVIGHNSVTERLRQAAREGRGAARRSGQSNTVASTRPYLPGDDLRHVHWQTTARRNALVVKEFEDGAEPISCLVIWDGAAYAAWGSDSLSTTESGLCLAASLYRALLTEGLACGVLRLDGAPQLLPIREGAPGGPLAANGRALELFADAAANRETALAEALQPFLPGLPKELDIYLITASLAPEVTSVAHRLRQTGARVSVGLINGAAFLDAKEKPSPMREPPAEKPQTEKSRKRITTVFEHWPRGIMTDAGNAPVRPESYHEQAQRLRAQGVAVIVTPDKDNNEQEPTLQGALQGALNHLLSTPA